MVTSFIDHPLFNLLGLIKTVDPFLLKERLEHDWRFDIFVISICLDDVVVILFLY